MAISGGDGGDPVSAPIAGSGSGRRVFASGAGRSGRVSRAGCIEVERMGSNRFNRVYRARNCMYDPQHSSADAVVLPDG